MSNYITKYVTKGLHATEHGAGEHLFYASRGLNGKRVVCVARSDRAADYEGEYCGITWVDARNNIALRHLFDALGRLGNDDKIVEAISDIHSKEILHSQYAPQAQNFSEPPEQLTFFGKESAHRVPL